MSKVEERLAALGHTIPDPGPPVANFVNAVRTGNMVFVSGHGPRRDSEFISRGKVGKDVDVEKHVNAKPITQAMDVAVARTLDALDNRTGNYSDFQRANIQNVFVSMPSTQRAIQKILEWGDEDPVAIDALALARLPLEGLYTLSLMFES